MTIYGYCRVSTGQQVERDSLDTQKRMIAGQAMALSHDEPIYFVEEGISAKIPLQDRPRGKELLATIAAGDTVIVPYFDRVFRNSRNALEMRDLFKERKVALYIMDSGGEIINSPYGEMIFTVLAAVTQLRREEIVERIRDSKRDGRAQGKFLGGYVPFGYRVDNNAFLVEDIVHMDALRRARKWNKEGLSPRRIAVKLKDEGITVSHETLRVAIAKLERQHA